MRSLGRQFSGKDGQKRKDYKIKGYDTHYIYTDEEGNTEFVVERQYLDESKQEEVCMLYQMEE